jgi:hypothetical protein
MATNFPAHICRLWLTAGVALVGAFAVSGVMHDLGMWGSEREQSSALLAVFSFSWALVLR